MKASLLAFAFLAALLSCPPAKADFFVVVQSTSPQPSMTHKEAVDLFMGRHRALRNGDMAQVFDMPRDSAATADFYRRLTGMEPAQINSYWARLMFSGQTMPPQPVADEAAMIDVIKRQPNAVGWVRKEPADKQLRVVLVIKESP